MYDIDYTAPPIPYRYCHEPSSPEHSRLSGFRYDNETLRHLDFNTFVDLRSYSGELTELVVRFQCRSVSLFKLDFLQQRTLSLQLSALPSYVQAFFNRLSKTEYVEYRTGLLSVVRSELAAHGVEFKGKNN